MTATWDDSGSGDNNSDTISTVTVDFSAFGGGSSVSASHSNDSWTATFTLPSSAVSNHGLNVSVTATDDAGNAATAADTSDATILTAAPGAVNSDLFLWLKADAEVFSDAGSASASNGQGVQQWHDQSGHHRDTEQTSSSHRPTLTTSTINQNPVLDFDASNDFLTFQSAFDAGSNFDFFVVVQPDNNTPVGIFDGGPGQSDVFRNHNAGVLLSG